jgi:hypothetical protein
MLNMPQLIINITSPQKMGYLCMLYVYVVISKANIKNKKMILLGT